MKRLFDLQIERHFITLKDRSVTLVYLDLHTPLTSHRKKIDIPLKNQFILCDKVWTGILAFVFIQSHI